MKHLTWVVLAGVLIVGACSPSTPVATPVPPTVRAPSPVPSATVAPTLVPAALAGPQAGTSMTWVDGALMVYVPAGEFPMGSERANADEAPVQAHGQRMRGVGVGDGSLHWPGPDRRRRARLDRRGRRPVFAVRPAGDGFILRHGGLTGAEEHHVGRPGVNWHILASRRQADDICQRRALRHAARKLSRQQARGLAQLHLFQQPGNSRVVLTSSLLQPECDIGAHVQPWQQSRFLEHETHRAAGSLHVLPIDQ